MVSGMLIGWQNADDRNLAIQFHNGGFDFGISYILRNFRGILVGVSKERFENINRIVTLS